MVDLNDFVGEEAVVDLYAFVEGVDCFAQMEDDNYSAIMVVADQPTQKHCSMLVRLTQMPGMSCCPEEPEAKRQKFDESGRVREDRFLAPPVMIKVSIPTMDGGQVLEMAVKSLSESVASLKEILARVLQMPTNRHKLNGKAGVFKNDKSLADYNVGGEILKLSPRPSRWT
ncbi:unnamed protein product [Arabis nemorensis]|uniref:Ubiquitin-like domain-containing protein n=1 Tax=Arabis nemorensis TaxID=586526 RepID=A0A565CM79_9BRAS|nr:unnamed protein product [Arabis nemorensis]